MTIPLVPNPLDLLEQGASNIAENWLIDLAAKAGQSAQLFLEKAATFWVTGIKAPQLTYATDQNPYTPASTIGYLWSHLHWYVSGLAVLSIFIAAGKMAVQRNGAPARELLQSILTLVVVSSAGIATISLLTTASDEAASYILKDAMKTPNGDPSNFQTQFGLMFAVPTPTNPTAFVLVGLMALVLIGSIVQVALLIIRGGMLFLLAGVLPLMAAATNTETGRQWFRKGLAWTIAFLLYKPVAAIVYATAFQLTREGAAGVPAGALAPTGGDQLIKVVTGLVMCFLAIFALPALMRFTVPAVAAAAGGGGGGVAALGGALAMGAKAALMSPKGSGGGGGKPPPPPPQDKSGKDSTGNGPQGNSKPGGGPTGQPPAKSAAVKAAGPAGAIAAGVADGLKKTNAAVNNAVSNAAGEDSTGAAPGKTTTPAKGPSGGSSPKGQTPTTKPQPPTTPPPPPPSIGPSGSQHSKPNPPNKPPTTEGPSGGKR